jgi:hypothetical protein
LKTHGIKIEDEEPAHRTGNEGPHFDDDMDSREMTLSAPRARNAEKGALFADKDNSHYVEK